MAQQLPRAAAAAAWFEEIPSSRIAGRHAGLVPWTSGEIALFVVRHYLGVRFDGGHVVLRPALYPGSPPVSADLRFRKGRLRLEIDGSGPALSARLDNVELKSPSDGSLRMPRDFQSGTVVIATDAEREGSGESIPDVRCLRPRPACLAGERD